jgi:hypothetical protein
VALNTIIPLYHVIIIKTNVLLPEIYVTLDDVGYPVFLLTIKLYYLALGVTNESNYRSVRGIMVFNATFNNMSVIS